MSSTSNVAGTPEAYTASLLVSSGHFVVIHWEILDILLCLHSTFVV
jgi:hypothetical protein